MRFHNSALHSKLGWQIYYNQDLSWVRAVKDKYLGNGHFLDAPIKNGSSWLWKGECLDLNIWSFSWNPSLPGFKPTPNPSISPLSDLNVSNLINRNINSWNTSLIHEQWEYFLPDLNVSTLLPQFVDWEWLVGFYLSY
jgi:hypothetical protein